MNNDDKFKDVLLLVLENQAELEYRKRLNKHLPYIVFIFSISLLLKNPICLAIISILILILLQTISKRVLTEIQELFDNRLQKVSDWLENYQGDEEITVSKILWNVLNDEI